MIRKRADGFIRELLRINMFKRSVFFLIADSLLIAFSVYVSFWLRFDGKIPAAYLNHLEYYIVAALAITLTMLALHGMYEISWRFFGLKDFLKLLAAITLSSVIMAFGVFISKGRLGIVAFPRSALLVEYILSLGSLGVLRISKRAIIEYLSKPGRIRKGQTRVLIVGAGDAGSSIGRDMLINKKSRYFPVGYVDDDPSKRGMSIHGIKVLGTRNDIPMLLDGNRVQEVLIAIPSFHSKDIRAMVEIIRNSDASAKIKILPGILDLMEGKITLSDIKEVQVEDLLGREKVQINLAAICDFLSGKRVMITGAGGSIGSEIVRTALTFNTSLAVLLDVDETEIFYLMRHFHQPETRIVPVIGDIRDRVKMDAVFAKYRPEIILHSAAYKHVPVMEDYPEEAVKTNVLGTKILGELALKYNAEKFIYISTDKAINPTSVMGSTKRVGEEILRVLNRQNGTKFISVRFGNVLGSRGSVIPVFEEQIKRGGPVTVTHPEMKRYFMATSEAVLLVLQAAATGEGGEAYILDMGEPIKILDIAREMIRLSGYEPDVDIPIVFSGLRPGEKLFEELLGAEEGSEPTTHPRIFRARNPKVCAESEILPKVESLIDMCSNGCNREGIIGCLMDIVPTYKRQGISVGDRRIA